MARKYKTSSLTWVWANVGYLCGYISMGLSHGFFKTLCTCVSRARPCPPSQQRGGGADTRAHGRGDGRSPQAWYSGGGVQKACPAGQGFPPMCCCRKRPPFLSPTRPGTSTPVQAVARERVPDTASTGNPHIRVQPAAALPPERKESGGPRVAHLHTGERRRRTRWGTGRRPSARRKKTGAQRSPLGTHGGFGRGPSVARSQPYLPARGTKNS